MKRGGSRGPGQACPQHLPCMFSFFVTHQELVPDLAISTDVWPFPSWLCIRIAMVLWRHGRLAPGPTVLLHRPKVGPGRLQVTSPAGPAVPAPTLGPGSAPGPRRGIHGPCGGSAVGSLPARLPQDLRGPWGRVERTCPPWETGVGRCDVPVGRHKLLIALFCVINICGERADAATCPACCLQR